MVGLNKMDPSTVHNVRIHPIRPVYANVSVDININIKEVYNVVSGFSDVCRVLVSRLPGEGAGPVHHSKERVSEVPHNDGSL